MDLDDLERMARWPVVDTHGHEVGPKDARVVSEQSRSWNKA